MTHYKVLTGKQQKKIERYEKPELICNRHDSNT